MKIKIDHIAKIEGHAGFVADIASGNVVKARLDVEEGARLLEGILRGRSYDEVSQISARICGVCPVVHNLTSLKALEAAMGVSISAQTILLRNLMMMGQILNSHALHLFFFSLSDFFGIKDDLSLIKKYPQKTKNVLLLRGFGNKIIEVVGGRSIHPLTPEVGGFKKLPDAKNLEELLSSSVKALEAALEMAKFLIKLEYPDFKRECQYVSLSLPNQYAICDGVIMIDGEEKIKAGEFMSQIKESQVNQSAVKRAGFSGRPYMVGALARINYQAGFLNPKAKEMLKTASLKLPSYNPFHNILAQAIEMIHCVEESRKILAQIKKADIRFERSSFEARAGKGYGAMEAPRGTLFYYYDLDQDGRIKDANIITPTSQNLARLEQDLAEYLPRITKGKSVCKEECENLIKMLVRAYDPCLTCATH